MSQAKEAVDAVRATPDSGSYQSILLDKLIRFRVHAFEDYVGEQFDVLVESIQQNGLIHPIVVRPLEGTEDYEILSGHNRVAAVKKLGWASTPAMIHKMTNDEAVLFANDANIAQRRFENWLPSEKAKSIFQYHAGIKKQGRRSDRAVETSGDVHQKSKLDARKETARVYRVSENTVRLYLDLYRLIEQLKKRLDMDEFGSTPAQALSCVPAEIQEIVESVLENDKDTCRITVDGARKVRDVYRSYEEKSAGELTEVQGNVRRLLSKETSILEVETTPFITIKMEAATYNLLFPGRDPDETVVKEIIEAVDYHREHFHLRVSKSEERTGA